MAREATITQEQVNAVADAICASGAKPTARVIRDHLGSGSMATVLRMLQVWQAQQVLPAPPVVDVPANVAESLAKFINDQINAGRASLSTALSAATNLQSEAIAENERQASTIEIQAEALEFAQAEKAEIAGRLAQVESDLARAQDDVTGERQAAETARTELAKAQLRLEAVPRIEADIERLRKELDAERQARTDAEQKAAVATAKLEAMTDRATKAETYAEKAERQAAQAAQELTSARVQVQAQQTALDASARECEDLRRQVRDAMDNAKTAEGQAAELRGQIAVLSKPAAPAKAPAKTQAGKG